jgi:hypothetical protein
MNQPTYKTIGKIIFWATALTVIVSIFIFLYVLNFRMNSISTAEFDFQGASAAASIIPSFSGILLAACAIYFQIKSTTPSHKAAEKILVDIITFRNLNLGYIYALQYSINKLNNFIWAAENSNDYTPEQERMIEEYLERRNLDDSTNWTEINERMAYSKIILEAEKGFFDIIAKNINTTNLELEKNSFSPLATRILPTIKFLSLNLNMPKELTFDFSQFERELNKQSVKYYILDINDDEEFKEWMISTMIILSKIENVISHLNDKKIINAAQIERHIINKNANLVGRKIMKELKEKNEIEQMILKSKSNKNRPLS